MRTRMKITAWGAVLLLFPGLLSCQKSNPSQLTYDHRSYALYPVLFDEAPEIPSPLTTKDGREFVVCLTHDYRFTIIPVTVENGGTLDYRKDLWWGKGRQLVVDTADFPTLAETGLHSETELNQTKTITGKSIAQITRIGRPGQYSTAGFLSQDEDIIPVLRADNRLVGQLGLIHPEMARPLFHIFNVMLTVKKDSGRGNIRGILYNNRTILLNFEGGKGWQESIFDDEILGYWGIDIQRELDRDEQDFLQRKYVDLTADGRDSLAARLSTIHTGEMVPYYIMRYGFYEGHTPYRTDPIAIAFIFGLRSIAEIEQAFDGRLPQAMNEHFAHDNCS